VRGMPLTGGDLKELRASYDPHELQGRWLQPRTFGRGGGAVAVGRVIGQTFERDHGDGYLPRSAFQARSTALTTSNVSMHDSRRVSFLRPRWRAPKSRSTTRSSAYRIF